MKRCDPLEVLCMKGPLSFNELVHVTGYSKGSISAKLRKLIENGKVGRVGKYYYANYTACRERQGKGLVLVIKTEEQEHNIALTDFITTLHTIMKITSPPQSRDNIDKQIDQIWEDINTIIAFVKENKAVLSTDINGNLTALNLPDDEKDKLESSIWSVAWAIESFLAREYVSDVYVIPIKYAVAYDDGKLIIFHNVEWSNA